VSGVGGRTCAGIEATRFVPVLARFEVVARGVVILPGQSSTLPAPSDGGCDVCRSSPDEPPGRGSGGEAAGKLHAPDRTGPRLEKTRLKARAGTECPKVGVDAARMGFNPPHAVKQPDVN